MTYEKWSEELSKAQIFKADDVKTVTFKLYDVFGEDYEEEDPKRSSRLKDSLTAHPQTGWKPHTPLARS